MPKPTLPLTDSQCKKLEPPNQLSDGGGLSRRARGNGKYWRFRYYRPSDNKLDEIRLGIYPAMSLKEAREEREELRGLVARGIDPKLYRQNEAQRQAEQMNNTFEAVARKWHADQAAKPDKWKPDHAGRVIRSLELHIFPDLARRQIGEIMPLEVLGLLQRLEAAGKHDTAHKVYDVVNQVFRYAVMLRLCIFNPAAELRGELAQVEQKHYRTITDPEKIGVLLRALDGYTGSPQTRALLQLSPYVFARPSELRLLRWCEIDWEARQYRKDGEEMKNGIGHIVPLSRQAIAILEGLKPVTGHHEFVFANIGSKKPLSEGAARKALARLGFLDQITPHGFRHMASTRLNEMGFNSDWIERQLAHKDPNATRTAYNHAEYLEQRAEMVQAWADYLDGLKAQSGILQQTGG